MRISTGIDFIQRGWANANMVVLRGGRGTVVVDPGHFLYVEQALELLGEIGVSAETITTILITHSHWDHASSINTLRHHASFQVGMGALTDQWMREEAVHEMWLSYFGVESRAHFCPADIVMLPDNTVELAGRPWQIVALPGHAPDTVGYFQADEGVLISADSIMDRGDCGVINTVVHGEQAFDDALLAVDRIEALNPRIILPGHGPAVTDVTTAITKLRRRLQRFKTDPQRHVTHFARRIVMAAALELEPQTRSELVSKIALTQWANDYAPKINMTATQLVDRTVVELMFGGALLEKDNKLHATVPR